MARTEITVTDLSTIVFFIPNNLWKVFASEHHSPNKPRCKKKIALHS
jgi:hypothetical protein